MPQSHWSNYYRSGALVTGPAGPSGSYDAEIEALWCEVMEPLPSGSQILDIGTGNGAIPAIASAHAKALQRQWSIHGIDDADIDPKRDVANGESLFADCYFYPTTKAEALPFSEAMFDLVCGQYALEYTNTPKTLAEVKRVLQPAGVARFVLHHHESILVEQGRRSLAEVELLLESAELYGKLRALISPEGPLQPIDAPDAKALHASIQMVYERLNQSTSTRPAQTLEVCIETAKQILYVRSQSSQPDEALALLSQAEEDLVSSQDRLKDLLAVALDESQIKDLIAQAAQLGLSNSKCELLYHQKKNLVGWLVDFTIAP